METQPTHQVRRLLVFFVSLALVAAGFVAIQPVASAQALDGSQFDAGYIIDDSNFFVRDAMTQAQIQSFLEAKQPGVCGNSLCLKNYSGITRAVAARYSDTAGRNVCEAYPGGNVQTAAAIIYQVQQSCSISAKVILVTLQKEEALITNLAPSQANINVAMGYGCPDTAACATLYYGFFNQVYAAALQFRTYQAAPAYFGYRAGRVNNIQYSPVAGCGTKAVYILNAATAALYNYTPYTPNAGALANLYGTVACGAYGNRNFWVYFNTWFGDAAWAGVAEIDALYQSLGGAAGSLGAAVGDVTQIDANGGGKVRGFANGAIAWSPGRGAFVVSGDFRVYYNANGGIAGPLGWPASPANANASGTGGTVQGFQNGAITRNSSGQFAILSGAIRTYYSGVGSLAGPLGWPTASAACTAQGVCTQTFAGGTVYSSAAKGSHQVLTPMAPTYQSSGGLDGTLGWPVTEPATIAANGGGSVQGFAKGAIVISKTTGASILTEPIRSAFNAYGGIAGAPGWPTSAPVCTSTTECAQGFQGGTVRASTAGNSFLATAVETYFQAAGGLTGRLGRPSGTSISIAANGGGVVQVFANGAVTSSPTGGIRSLSGGLRTYFNQVGGIAGSYGWPTTEQACTSAGVCAQSFMGGVITWSPTLGGSAVRK